MSQPISADALWDVTCRILRDRFTVEVAELPSGHRAVFGRWGDVMVEINTYVVGDLPIVRATTEFARYVPDTPLLRRAVNDLNTGVVDATFGIYPESDERGAVQVRSAGFVFGEAIGADMIALAVGSCADNANYVLNAGFLNSFGGRLGHEVFAEEWSRLLGG